MRDVYLLRYKTTKVFAVADSLERLNMEMANYSERMQRDMRIENHDLLEEGD